MAVKTFNIPILYSMDTRRFDTPMRDCLRDIGVYFGDYYWFMSGYTPVSSRNAIASAKINCISTETCPGGERHDIDVGETARFNYGFDVRVNNLIPGYPDAYANITVTEVDIVPDMNISSILLDKTSVTIGDEVIFEACMTNNGGRGDIELYTGFAYQDFINGPPLYLNGYVRQTIGDVLVGEYLCPYGIISVTQEVIDAKESGKDVKFWASAIPGNSLSKSINIEIPQEPIFCTQQFRVEDQDRNPLISVISSPTWDIDLQVPSTGEASLYMEQGITYTVTAYNYEHNLQQTRTFTTCTSQPLIFVLDIPDPCEGVICENICTDEGHLVIRECDPDLGICQDIKTELNSPECVQPDEPTLTTIITSPEPYIVGTNIGIETILKTSAGVPIYGEDVFFYTPTEFLGANLTNSDGKVTISFLTSEVPSTYEIYTTHLTDDDVFIESNHITFTTKEPVVPYCTQKLRLLDQDGNLVGGKFYSTEFGEFFTSGEFEFNVEEGKTIEITGYHYNLSLTKTITTCTTEPLDFIFDTEEPEPDIGKIGAITYEIIKRPLNDQITFYIPVTNLTDEEQCFYINLMDPENETEVLEKAPNIPLIGRIADRIPAGATEVIELSSTWDVRWNINNVIGQVVTFELRHSEPVFNAFGVVVCNPLKSAYDIVDKITYDLTNIDIIVSVCADNTEGLITKDLQIGLMYSDPLTITKTDVCMSPMNVINIANEEFCTSWHRPGPFICSGSAYLADSMFVAYARGFDDEDNEYIITSPIFRSIYGTKNISIKITGEPIEECFIDHPFDDTKCLITNDQWTFIKWTAIALGSLYVVSVAAPLVKGAGEGLQALTKR